MGDDAEDYEYVFGSSSEESEESEESKEIYREMKIRDEFAIVLITTHGEIPIRPTLKGAKNPLSAFPRHEIPEFVETTDPKDGTQWVSNVTIYSLTAMPPGVCNIAEPDSIAALYDFISQNKNDPRWFNDPLLCCQEIKNFYEGFQRQEYKEDLQNQSKKRKLGQKPSEEYLFHQHGDLGLRINVLNSGDQIINKTFSRNNKEALLGKGKDWAITLYEKHDNIDIFQVIQNTKQVKYITKPDGTTEMQITPSTTMSRLIRKLVSDEYSKKNIVIIDLSCSAFKSLLGQELTPQAVRHSRRMLISQGFGGRKSKKNRRNKRNKIKKFKRNVEDNKLH